MLPLTDPGQVDVLGVWDVNDRDGPWQRHLPETFRWAEAHFGELRNQMFRAEFCRLDGIPAAVVHLYDDADPGKRHLDWLTGEPARLPPMVLPLDELPPVRLLH
jgi:hypothetical protein